MKEIILLGATGSIGTQALEIIKRPHEYQVEAISFGYNITLARDIIKNYFDISEKCSIILKSTEFYHSSGSILDAQPIMICVRICFAPDII